MRRHSVAVVTLLLLASNMPLAQASKPASKQPPRSSRDWNETERWVWSQVVNVNQPLTVKLQNRCSSASRKGGGTLIATSDKYAALRNRCRTIRGAFLRDVLTRAPWQEAIPARGLGLDGAHVVGELDLTNAKLVRAFWLENSLVDSNVSLLRTRTDSVIGFDGTLFAGKFNADALQSDSDVLLRSTIFENGTSLVRARIAGQVDMTTATVKGTFDGQGLQAFDVFLRSDNQSGPSAVFAGKINFMFARISNTLDLRGATLADVDMSGASVSGVLRLGARQTAGTSHTKWRNMAGEPSTLTLINAQVGSLADEENAWPETGHLKLDGFSFAHISGSAGQIGNDKRNKKRDWWVKLDTQYSATPYAQLTAALLATGDRGAAHEIQYLGREGRREAAWKSGSWSGWLGLTLLWAVAGYGIGGYTFIVLLWVFLLASFGGLVLYCTVPAGRSLSRGPVWCFGASLSHLLPVVEINKEFADFFNDPDRERLKKWQAFAFDCLAIMGWVLGAILIAAISSLTQSP